MATRRSERRRELNSDDGDREEKRGEGQESRRGRSEETGETILREGLREHEGLDWEGARRERMLSVCRRARLEIGRAHV